jgi:hypothetical protein
MINLSNKSCRENQNILRSVNDFRKLCHLWDNVEKCDGAREARVDNIKQAHAFCMLDKDGYTCTHALVRTYRNVEYSLLYHSNIFASGWGAPGALAMSWGDARVKFSLNFKHDKIWSTAALELAVEEPQRWHKLAHWSTWNCSLW